MDNNIMYSDDIISKAVREYRDYLIDSEQCVDVDYIVYFKQSYYPIKDFEECIEIVSIDFDNNVTLWSDFCEGQKFVTDIKIYALYEIKEVIKNAN